MSESDGAPSVRWAAAGSPDNVKVVKGLPGATFPAEGDPQGTHLLVVSSIDDERGHQEALWLVPETGRPTPLGTPSRMVRNPAWSPDGAWLAFESDLHSFRDLYRVDRAGSVERLTTGTKGNYEPDVAADGSITFVSSRDGNAEIYVMGAHGELPLRITHHPGNDTNPTWSPDGQRVAWLAWRGEQVSAQLVERGQTVGRPVRATPHPGELDRGISWSPKGDRVAITTQIGPKDVAVDIVGLDGTRIARLDGPGPDEHPVWSPTGDHLVFASSRNGEPDLYVVAADGTGIRPLVTGPAADWLPRWSP